MSPLQFKLFSALTLIHVVLMFGPHSVKADFSDTCVNSTNSTSCSRTYEHVYNSLAKSENSFNIESALYPAKKPSSVRVFVDVYGPNKTRVHMEYTWSISCLYVAVPDTVLGILSLGSILVNPRTQYLSIQIPLFCCNVSEKDDDRRTIIKEMIEGALAALQDLAISPGIRDPTLNTAECVIEGHKMDIDATGLEHHIRIIIILLLPVFLAFASCPLLANFLEEYRRLAWPRKEKSKQNIRNKDTGGPPIQELVEVTEQTRILEGSQETTDSQDKDSQEKEEKNKNKINTAMAVCKLSFVLAVIGGLIFIIAFGFWICHCSKEKAPPDIYALAIPIIILLLIVAYDILVFCYRIKKLDDVARCSFFFTTCAIVTSYFSCWLLIGIMINPTWGLTVTLLVCFTFAAIGFAVYEYHNEISKDPKHKDQSRWSCALLMLTAIFLVALVILAGQSYNGRETADESLKAALLSVIGALVYWVSWKRHVHTTQSPSSGKPADSAQTPIQPPLSGNSSAENGLTNAPET